MGLAMVAVAKLSLVGGGGHHGLTPLVTALLWPFILKFAFSFRPLRETCTDMSDALRLFFFQMSQIAFDNGAAAGGGGPRWQRALRLVYERVTHARHAQPGSEGDDSLIALSMLAL
ncbi:hypothetical protein ACS0TY_033031 [Phlomoides rotata]